MGKAPVGVARAAKKYGCKVIAFAGSVTKEAAACNDNGIDAFFPIVRGACTLEEAMQREKAMENQGAAPYCTRATGKKPWRISPIQWNRYFVCYNITYSTG